MTTIAANREGMAADRFVSNGHRTVKIHRFDGGILGFSGSLQQGLALAKWFVEGKRGSPPNVMDEGVDETDLLILRNDGIYGMDTTGVEYLICTDCAAIGSGSDLATGAMAAGKSPLEAVTIAADYDAGTKGPFDYLPLKPGRGKTRSTL